MQDSVGPAVCKPEDPNRAVPAGAVDVVLTDGVLVRGHGFAVRVAKGVVGVDGDDDVVRVQCVQPRLAVNVPVVAIPLAVVGGFKHVRRQ